jgi:hypothetical protein
VSASWPRRRGSKPTSKRNRGSVLRRRAILASIPAWLAPPGSRWGRLARRTRPPDRGAQPLAREDQHQPKRDLLNIVQDVTNSFLARATAVILRMRPWAVPTRWANQRAKALSGW